MKLFSRVLGEGRDLIILHGLYGAGENWLTIARNLSSHYKVHLPDLRNHGNSPHHPEHSYALLVEDLKEYIDDADIRNPVILGHSMGGKTAMWYSIRYPDNLSALIVVDISPVSYVQVSQPSGIVSDHLNIMNGLRMVDISVLKTRTAIDNALMEYIPSDKVRQFLLKSVGRDHEGKFFWKINVEVLSQYLPEVMKGIDVEKYPPQVNPQIPVLFIRGEMSGYIPDEDLEAINRLYPQADIETIFNAGHWVHAENPEAFLSVVNHFLESLE